MLMFVFSRLDFIPYEVQRPPVHVPEQYKPKDGDIDLLTSYTKDFPHRRAAPQPSCRGQHTRTVTPGAFRGTPTYVGEFDFIFIHIFLNLSQVDVERSIITHHVNQCHYSVKIFVFL